MNNNPRESAINGPLRPAPDVLFQEVNGELVLLQLERDEYFSLNAVGARVWTLLDDGLGRAAIVRRLLEEYEVERAVLEADVDALLRELVERGLALAGPRGPGDRADADEDGA